MANNQSVLILKQLESGFSTNKPLSGIVRIDSEFGVTELSLSLINLAPTSENLALYIFGQTPALYTFNLPQRPTGYRKVLDQLAGVGNGFAAALVSVKSDIPLTVAFGKTENFDITLSQAKRLIADKCLAELKIKKKNEQVEPEQVDSFGFRAKTSPYTQTFPHAPSTPQAEPEQVQPTTVDEQVIKQYNDEAVATVNYFELDQELNDKLNQIKNKENEELSNANGDATDFRQEEKEKIRDRTDFLSNEEDLFAGEVKKDTRPFYITAEQELKTLFEKFPRYDNLKCYFPDSTWVKINYDNDRFYIVGLIKEDKKEKYICYGVPSPYSPEPPKELKGYCTFIPLSIFDMQGEGFWMMFQDAVTGECITLK